MALDLASLNTTNACNKGAEVQLKNPFDNTPLEMYITVLGSDSTEFKAFTRERTNIRLKKDALAQKRGKDAEIRTVEGIESENIDLLVTCMVGWRGIVLDAKVSKDDLPFNVPNAIKVLKENSWIYSQINDAVGDIGLFVKN